jgi:hypothetical protein
MSESGLIDRVILFTHQDRPPKALPPAGQRKTAGWTTAWTSASG